VVMTSHNQSHGSYLRAPRMPYPLTTAAGQEVPVYAAGR